MTTEQQAVIASDLSLTGDEGPVFGPLDLEIPLRGMTNITGRGGSGRTALALVLAGRMKPSRGDLEVLGETSRRKIQKMVAIAGIEQVDMMERSVKVKDVLNENLAWETPWWKFAPKAGGGDLEDYCADLYGDRSYPPLDAYISELSGLDKLMLRVALALKPAHRHPVKMLILDDLEQVHSLSDRNFLLQRLDDLSQDMTIVINSVNPISASIEARKTIRVDINAGHVVPENPGSYDGRKCGVENRTDENTTNNHSEVRHGHAEIEPVEGLAQP